MNSRPARSTKSPRTDRATQRNPVQKNKTTKNPNKITTKHPISVILWVLPRWYHSIPKVHHYLLGVGLTLVSIA